MSYKYQGLDGLTWQQHYIDTKEQHNGVIEREENPFPENLKQSNQMSVHWSGEGESFKKKQNLTRELKYLPSCEALYSLGFASLPSALTSCSKNPRVKGPRDVNSCKILMYVLHGGQCC